MASVHYEKFDDIRAHRQGILETLNKKKTNPSFLQPVGRLSKYDPEKPLSLPCYNFGEATRN